MNPTQGSEDQQPWLTDTERLLRKEGYLNEEDVTRRLASTEAAALGKSFFPATQSRFPRDLYPA